jgi:RNA polymerase sigma-70 factor (ECF subfamily)
MSDLPSHDVSPELAARLARGDGAAFAELYDACADRLHGYLAAKLGARDAASDVVQAAFLRAVKSRRRFRGVENPVAYMFQIARNEALRIGAKRRLDRQQMPTEELLAATGESRDDIEVISVALGRLNPDERELVELKIFSGLTFREIAEVVGRPAATVATQYRRALESLRPWLAKQYR